MEPLCKVLLTLGPRAAPLARKGNRNELGTEPGTVAQGTACHQALLTREQPEYALMTRGKAEWGTDPGSLAGPLPCGAAAAPQGPAASWHRLGLAAAGAGVSGAQQPHLPVHQPV